MKDLGHIAVAFLLLLLPPMATAVLAFEVWRGSPAHFEDPTKPAEQLDQNVAKDSDSAPPSESSALSRTYTAAKQSVRVRTALLILCSLCVFAYVVYFSETYHVGVLCLALMAWYIAFAHLAHLETGHENLLTRLYAHSRQMEKRMEYSFSNNLKAFYEDFLARVKGAHRRVFSVERVWTMPKRWSSEFESKKRDDSFKALLKELQKDELFVALTKTQAKDIIFIGPSPRRTNIEGYLGKELEQFYGMVYTACILELARTKRLEDQAKNPKLQSSNGIPEERVRIRCAVGDVPCWVKIVDDGFFDMFGTPPLHFGYEDHFNEDDRLLSRVAQYETLILEYENYTQRVYTYVSAELLYWLSDKPKTSLVREDDLKMFLFGNSELEGNEVRGKLKVQTGVDLLKFFFTLHYRKKLKLDDLDIPFRSLTYHQLWERCS